MIFYDFLGLSQTCVQSLKDEKFCARMSGATACKVKTRYRAKTYDALP